VVQGKQRKINILRAKEVPAMIEQGNGGVTGSLFDRGSSTAAHIDIGAGEIKLSNLERRNVIFGRPGTAKTTTITRIIADYLSSGGTESSLLYLTYSRSMAKDAREKTGLSKNFVGTLHSILSRKLGWKKGMRGEEGDYLSDDEVTKFCEKYGIKKKARFRAWDEEESDEDDDWNFFMQYYDAARNRIPPLKLSDLDRDGISPFDLDYVAYRYDELKRTLGKHDYTDILIEASKMEFMLLDLLIVDEAQDLTPIMWYIVEKIASVAGRTVFAGDELQSIYGFKGADPAFLLAKKKDSKVLHLKKSYRLTVENKELADRIARRITVKEDIKFDSNGRHGRAEYGTDIDSVLAQPGERWFLCRTRYLAMYVAKYLKEKGIVYLPINQRHASLSPWSLRLIELNNALASWPNVPIESMVEILRKLPASMLQRGVKTLANEKKYDGLKKIIGESLLGVNDTLKFFRDPNVTRREVIKSLSVPDEKKSLLFQFEGRKIMGDEVVRVDTFHASKGLEATNVGVILNLTKKTYESYLTDPDSEYRNLYVAVTRSKENVFLIQLNIPGGMYYDI